MSRKILGGVQKIQLGVFVSKVEITHVVDSTHLTTLDVLGPEATIDWGGMKI